MPIDLESAVVVSRMWPELTLIAAAIAVLLMGLSDRVAVRRAIPVVALAAMIIPMGLLVRAEPTGEINGGMALGSMVLFVRKIALTLGMLLTLVNWSQPREEERGEYFGMMLLSLSGLMLTALADNLVMMFLALELVSIPTYVLVTLSRRNTAAVEAGTKYFYLGAMAAAVTAFGFSYLYGASGTASMGIGTIGEVLRFPGGIAGSAAAIGVVLSLAGLCFKIAAVPLHFYIADVYQGAAGPVAGFLGFVPKLAGFVAIGKVLAMTDWPFGVVQGPLFWTLWIVAGLSMTVGNVLALMQTNIKRMLAYSGVAHSGYMLVGLLAGPRGGDGMLGDGAAAVMYYMSIYGIANLTAFAVLSILRSGERPAESLRDVTGLLRRHPSLAMLVALAMFTLMGLPPTAGFWGKMSLFGSALSASRGTPEQSWMIALVVLGVVNSAIAAAYYLRVIAACLLYENDQPAEAMPREWPRTGAVLCGFLLLIFSFVPGLLMRGSQTASHEWRSARGAGGIDPLAARNGRDRDTSLASDTTAVARSASE